MKEITRRETIQLTAASFGYLTGWLSAIISASTTTTAHGASQLQWSTFLSLLSQLAKERRSLQRTESDYADRASRLLKALGSHNLPPTRPLTTSPLAHPEFDEMKRAADYQVTLITMSSGHTIPAHDHPGITGVTSCISGSLAVSEYDLLPQSTDPGHAHLRLTRTGELAVGDTACVMTQRSNVHHLVSKGRTQLLDIFTPPYDDARLRRSHWYHLEERQIAPGIYRATAEQVRK